MFFLKRFFSFILFITTSIHILLADNNIASNALKLSEKASQSEKGNNLPNLFLYPDYFKNSDQITWENIKKELFFKYSYLKGKRPEKPYVKCHKFQRRITKFIKEAIVSGTINISEVNNNFLFTMGSGIEKVFTSKPIIPDEKHCKFHSIGNLKENCLIYCDYHGMDFNNDFFNNHKDLFEKQKPFLVAEDIAELIIFIPTFILFCIVISLLISRHRKQKQ